MHPDAMKGCPYDHSIPFCTRCGHHNAAAAFAERMAACKPKWDEYARRTANDASLSEDAFEHGFEAGYAHANQMLVAFFDLAGIKSPLAAKG